MKNNEHNLPDVSLEYSLDNGNTWNLYDFYEGEPEGEFIYLNNIGDTVKFRGENESFALDINSEPGWYYFGINGSVRCDGHITSIFNNVGGDYPLTDYACEHLFANCDSLVTAPELPSTTLGEYCYSEMFVGCNSLEKAPELPATTLPNGCYYGMFSNCTSLRYIKAMFLDVSSYSTEQWVFGVSPTGTFVKNAEATWNVTGINGIPDGWTVETANS